MSRNLLKAWGKDDAILSRAEGIKGGGLLKTSHYRILANSRQSTKSTQFQNQLPHKLPHRHKKEQGIGLIRCPETLVKYGGVERI